MKIAVVCKGFIGDHLFATGLAPDLKELHKETFEFGVKEVLVDYIVEVHQVMGLFENDPNIDNVYHVLDCPNLNTYDKIYTIPEVDQSVPPPLQFRQYCGIQNNNCGYKIYTNKGIDRSVKKMVKRHGKKLIGWQANWSEKSFLYTPKQYEEGVNHPPDLGYGGKRRDVEYIVDKLSKDYNMVVVGYPSGTPNNKNAPMGGIMSAGLYSATASLLKMCDYMIGGESGLINLAAGVGTKTIITGDFVHQLYGPNGCIKKIAEPKLGPEFYFPNTGHVSLDPYATDQEVVEQIKEIING